jgi:hypothetical protein
MYHTGITKLPKSNAPKCIEVQSENCINCPPFGSSCSGSNALFINQAKSSTIMAVIKLAQPKKCFYSLSLSKQPKCHVIKQCSKTYENKNKQHWKEMILMQVANNWFSFSATIKVGINNLDLSI